MLFRSLNIRGWRCFFFFAVDSYWIEEILLKMSELEAPPSILERARKKMREDKMDTGFTYSSYATKQSVVVIGKQSSGAEFLNSFCHELRHLTDDIASVLDYPMKGEKVAYLTGDIALEVADIVCMMCCDRCRI